MGVYHELSSTDFGTSYQTFYLYDTSKKVDGLSPNFDPCSYHSFYFGTYYEYSFDKAEKYNYKGIEIYFLKDILNYEIHIRKGNNVYKVYSVYNRTDGNYKERKETKEGLKKYNDILKKVQNSVKFVSK